MLVDEWTSGRWNMNDNSKLACSFQTNPQEFVEFAQYPSFLNRADIWAESYRLSGHIYSSSCQGYFACWGPWLVSENHSSAKPIKTHILQVNWYWHKRHPGPIVFQKLSDLATSLVQRVVCETWAEFLQGPTHGPCPRLRQSTVTMLFTCASCDFETGLEVVHQPIPSKGLPGTAQAAPVVEKIYLRDQAVQSDPPPLGFEDNIIKDKLLL